MATPPAESAAHPPPAPFPAWAWVLVGVLAGLLAGSGLGLAVGLRFRPEERFTVSVSLRTDSTAEDKARVEAALPDGARLQSREESYAEMRELFKDRPEILKDITLESAQEVYEVEMRARVFDCGVVAPFRGLPGVADTGVVQEAAGDRPAAIINCPA